MPAQTIRQRGTAGKKRDQTRFRVVAVKKTPTGINGIEEITRGGLPKGRSSLVCGTAGCGKTLFGMEFIVRGATEFNEPGVFMAFEEKEAELTENVASLGFDLKRLIASKKLVLDHVRVERSEIEETGEYDLEGLFIRLGYAIDSIGAKRVVLDTIEGLFAGLPNEGILRAELRRLFGWLKDKGVTSIITAERGEGTLTRHGLEEYVADCVILLDHRVVNQVSTRRLRVVKYRGSLHGTNEYPFLIGKDGITVLPITSLGLSHSASTQRVSTGIARLDAMFSGKGYYRGSSVLVSGSAGTGKSSLAASFVLAACRRGERCLYFAFEESPDQILRNMRSIGIELAPFVKRGLLQFYAIRPYHHGLESHLVEMHDQMGKLKPSVVVMDPVTNLMSVAADNEVKGMLTRLIDYLKMQHITALFTSLTQGDHVEEQSEVGISSLMDTWISLKNVEQNGERNRVLQVLKSRGMSHSNQVREFQMSRDGLELLDVYRGSNEMLTGSARLAQEARERAESLAREQQIARLKRARDRKETAAQARMAAIQAELMEDMEEISRSLSEETARSLSHSRQLQAMGRKRMADRKPQPGPVRNMEGNGRIK